MSLCLCIKHLLTEPSLIPTIVLIVKYLLYFSITVIYKVFSMKNDFNKFLMISDISLVVVYLIRMNQTIHNIK